MLILLQNLQHLDYKNFFYLLYIMHSSSMWHRLLVKSGMKICATNYEISLTGDEYSALKEMNAGVHKGSILGPILYFLYAHDIPQI